LKDKLVAWINRQLTHPRDIEGPPVKTVGDYGIRVVMHVLATFSLIPCFYAHWSFVIAWIWMMKVYQRNEDRHTVDQAWKDIAGILDGLPVVSSVICLMVYVFGLVPWYVQ